MAYDIARNQILAQPVTAFYEGRALRNAERQSEQQGHLLDAQTERIKAETDAIKNPPVDHEKRLKTYSAAFGIVRDMEAQTLSGYQAKIEAGVPEPEARAWAQERFMANREQAKYLGIYDILGEAAGGVDTRDDADLQWDPEAAIAAISSSESALEEIKQRRDPRLKLERERLGLEGEKFEHEKKTDAEKLGIDRERLEIDRSNAGNSDKAEKENFERANTLRDEYNMQAKDFQTVGAAYQTVLSVAKKPSAAGDIALLTSYMRLIDPGSTVREGEFATAESAGGVPARIRARYNKLLQGERLSQEQRKDFVGKAGELYQGRAQEHGKLRTKYSTLSERAGIDPADVVGDESLIEAPVEQTAGPVQIKTEADYARLPAGAEYVGPDGKRRRKKS